MKNLVLAVVVVVMGCFSPGPIPPWDENVLFTQTTASFVEEKVVVARLLAWGTDVTEVRDSTETRKLEYALVLYEVTGNDKGRYIVLEAYRYPGDRVNSWVVANGIADDFIGGESHEIPGYDVLAVAPTTQDLLRRAPWLALKGLDRHVHSENWRNVTGERPPRL